MQTSPAMEPTHIQCDVIYIFFIASPKSLQINHFYWPAVVAAHNFIQRVRRSLAYWVKPKTHDYYCSTNVEFNEVTKWKIGREGTHPIWPMQSRPCIIGDLLSVWIWQPPTTTQSKMTYVRGKMTSLDITDTANEKRKPGEEHSENRSLPFTSRHGHSDISTFNSVCGQREHEPDAYF